MSHTHEHTTARRPLALALALILGLMAGEVVAGILAGSLALLADAGHMLTDAAALVLALGAATFAGRPARGRWTFGFRRLEILAAHVNGITLLVVGVVIVYTAVRRLIDPPEVRGGIVLALALAGIAVNLVATALLARPSRHSLNVRGAFLHVVTDLAAFAGTAVAGGVILATGWNRADPVASLVVAGLIFWSSWVLLRESTRILLDVAPSEPREVAEAMLALPEVVEVHDLHVWTVGSGFPSLSAHVLVEPGADCHALRQELAALLAERFGLSHTTLQVEHAPALAREGNLPLALTLESGFVAGLEGKTAIVTGASSGIGAAVAHALRRGGPAVAGGARRTDQLETELRLELDVTDPASCERFVEEAARELGGLDILVNNAGLALGRDPFDASSEEDEETVLETNVHGLMRMTRLCLPHLRDGGHIVNMGSIAGTAGLRERRRLRGLQVRGARLLLRAPRGPARPPDPCHDRRPGPRRVELLARALPRRRGEGGRGLRRCRAAHARRRRRLRRVRGHAPAARQRRRDRGQGARPVEPRPHRPRTPSVAHHDPRRLDLLHLRRARRHRRARRRASSPTTRASSRCCA